MRVSPLLFALIGAQASGALAQTPTAEATGRPCGFRIAPCPAGSTCSALNTASPETRCFNCPGRCEATATATATTPTHTYSACGGFRTTPRPCAPGHLCVDDPYRGGCGMACDIPGLCVPTDTPCGGFLGLECPSGKLCVDDPRDDCDPKNGGADCIGLCV